MFDQANGVLEIKVEMTAIKILNAFLFVFFNYNSIEICNTKYGQFLL